MALAMFALGTKFASLVVAEGTFKPRLFDEDLAALFLSNVEASYLEFEFWDELLPVKGAKLEDSGSDMVVAMVVFRIELVSLVVAEGTLKQRSFDEDDSIT
mmetsp:Transcript_14742/g.22508  ORF Transcript_14742/g.22508 Transcript_14742/m.22508 type:complete len:101 (+) Transcript_14742:685-987(+)